MTGFKVGDKVKLVYGGAFEGGYFSYLDKDEGKTGRIIEIWEEKPEPKHIKVRGIGNDEFWKAGRFVLIDGEDWKKRCRAADKICYEVKP